MCWEEQLFQRRSSLVGGQTFVNHGKLNLTRSKMLLCSTLLNMLTTCYLHRGITALIYLLVRVILLYAGFRFSRCSYLLSLLRPHIYRDLELKVIPAFTAASRALQVLIFTVNSFFLFAFRNMG